MKNLFLTLILILGTGTSFAGSSVEIAEEFDCVPTTLSCGIEGWSCGETAIEIIENAIAADEALCP